MQVLVLNPGSSSLKAALIEQPGDNTLAAVERDWGLDATRRSGRAGELGSVVGELTREDGRPDIVAYRVVHGGNRFSEPTLVDDRVLTAIEELDDLAPLHNAVAAETIAAGRRTLPDLPHVACFDTAFHARLPEAARRYPLPEAWYAEWGIRRFGFHGLSVSWAVDRASELLGRPVSKLELVVAHLGSGASVTAVSGGRSVETSMGMTPLEGLMMGTRSGSIDPGILLYLLRAGRMAIDEVADALAHRSGLLGVSGRTASVVELERAARDGDPASALALEMFARRAAAGIAAAATGLERLDALVFTGGIGEHSHGMRTQICSHLSTLAVPAPNHSGGGADAVLAAHNGCAVLRVRAREDLIISRQVAAAGFLAAHG